METDPNQNTNDMKKFYYIARIQTWINVMNIDMIFRDGVNWTIVLRSGERLSINDGEYTDLMATIQRTDEERKEHRDKE